MYRATTPTHTFTFPFLVSTLNWAQITYSQDGNILLQKTLSDCGRNGYNLVLILTQAETKQFVEGFADVQIRYGTSASEALTSEKIDLVVRNVLYDATLPA